MPHSQRPPPSFIEALFGLMLSPGETTEELLERSDPPYGITMFVCLMLTIFVPIFAQIYKYGVSTYETPAMTALCLAVSVTFLAFFFFEFVLLRICGVGCPIYHVFSTAAYCLAPVLLTMWLIYLFNYLSTGRLSVLELLLTGHISGPDRFLGVIPIAALIAYLMMFVVLFYSLRFIGQMYSETALLMTVLSLLPLALSAVLGVTVAEILRPGSSEVFWRLLFNPAAFGALTR